MMMMMVIIIIIIIIGFPPGGSGKKKKKKQVSLLVTSYQFSVSPYKQLKSCLQYRYKEALYLHLMQVERSVNAHTKIEDTVFDPVHIIKLLCLLNARRMTYSAIHLSLVP
jgi:hypothetical protein